MPGRFLTDAERERFAGFPKTIPLEECVTSFTLSPTDLDLVRLLRGGKNRLGCALQLGSIRYLGFAPDDLTTAPEAVVSYVAAQLDIDPAELAGYGQRAHTRTDHLQAVLRHLKFRLPTAEDLGALASWLTERALEHDSPLVLFISASDHLKSLSIVRPGVTILERLVVAAREAAHQETYRRLEPLLTETLLPQLDLLLLVSPETNRTPLTWLRSGAEANTPEEILANLDKLRYLQGLGVPQWELKVVSPNRIKFLAQIGKRTTNQALQRMLPQRRYPILVAFLADALETITDQTVDLVNECLAAAYHRAEHDLDRFRRRYAKATNEKLRYFDIMGRLTLDHSVPDFALRQRIHEQIPPDDLEIALNENQIIMRPLDDNYVDFFGKRFNYIRQFSLRYLDTLQFHAYEETHPLLIAISHLRRTKRSIPKDAPLSFVPWRWHPYVVTSDGTLNRTYYELCTLMALREELRAGNIWLEHSRRYADPATYLIPTEQWESNKAEMCTLLGVSEIGEEQLKLRQKELEDLLATFDAALPMEEVRIEHHALVVSPLTAEQLPERVLQVREWVSASLPLVDLVDLLIEVDEDLHFTDHLTHAGGQETRMPDLKISLYAAILAQGCNYGLMRMAQMADISYETLVWATEWYIRDETLKAANAAIVNAHHQLPLSRQWGGGTMSSSDGQRFPVPVKARNARALPRYLHGKGVTFYTWTSDQLSQYGTKVTVMTMRDATYVLDEILDNITDLPIREHAVDTAGFTELVFCFFDLLGLRFSPRIKDLADQWIYRMSTQQRYEAIEPLLKGTINRKLILKYYDELLRIAGSLKKGYVTASLFIEKLQTSGRQNELARAAQEYGRVGKSIFLCRYFTIENYRRRINAQLNKGESLHALRAFLRCANEGAVRKRQPEEHLDQALCLTILTNAVIYWNTIYMQEAVDRLREKGYEILDEDLAHIAPSHYAHINPHGKMHFEVHDGLVPRPRRPLRDIQAVAVPQVHQPHRRGRPKKQTATREVMNAETTENDAE